MEQIEEERKSYQNLQSLSLVTNQKFSSKQEFEGKILLIEDSFIHSSLLLDQLCRIMGFPKESITLATDGQ